MALKFDIKVDDQGNVSIDKLGKGVKKLKNDTSSFGQTFKAVFGAQLLLKGLSVATNAVKDFVAQFGKIADAGDVFDKMSQKVGVSVEFLSGFGHVANLAGSSIEQMGPAFGRLSRNMNDANDGLKSAKDSFDALGISVKGSDGSLKSVDQMTLEVSDKFKDITDQTKKAALAQELFGRAGLDMIPILDQGTASIRAQMEEAERLGIVMSQDDAKAAAEYKDAITKLSGAWEGLKRQTIIPLLEEMTPLIDYLTEAVAKNKDKFVNLAVHVKNFCENFIIGIQGVLLVFDFFAKGFHDIFVVAILKGVDFVLRTLSSMIYLVQKMAFDIINLGGPMAELAKPVAKLTSSIQKGLSGVNAVVNDTLTSSLETNDKLTKDIADRIQKIQSMISSFSESTKKVSTKANKQTESLVNNMKSKIPEVEAIATEMGQAIGSGFGKGVEGAKDVFKSVFGMLIKIGTSALGVALGGPAGLLAANIVGGAAGSAVQGFADGSPALSAGGVKLVGERGPELVHIPAGSKISSAGETQQRIQESINRGSDYSNGAGSGFNNYGIILGEEKYVRDTLIPLINQEIKRR